MHPYTIDTGIRKKIFWGIFIISIIVSSFLTYWFGGCITNIRAWLQQFDWLDQILNICDAFGITTNFLGIPVTYAGIYWLVDNHLWRKEPFKKFFNIPDLHGHWEGTLKSSTYETTIDMQMDIKQTMSEISFVSIFPKSKSTSDVASIFVKKEGIIKVGFGFFNRSRELQHQYDGYNIIEIDDGTHLFGRYFNNRDNSNANIKDGNVGTFELHKID